MKIEMNPSAASDIGLEVWGLTNEGEKRDGHIYT